MIGPSGNVECSGSTGYQPCELEASGKFALVVDGGYGQTETGSYRATTKRVTEPTGCADPPLRLLRGGRPQRQHRDLRGDRLPHDPQRQLG